MLKKVAEAVSCGWKRKMEVRFRVLNFIAEHPYCNVKDLLPEANKDLCWWQRYSEFSLHNLLSKMREAGLVVSGQGSLEGEKIAVFRIAYQGRERLAELRTFLKL